MSPTTPGFAVLDSRGRVIGFATTKKEAEAIRDAFEARSSIETCATDEALMAYVDGHPGVRVGIDLEGFPAEEDAQPVVVFSDPEAEETVVRWPASEALIAWCRRPPLRAESLVTFAGTFKESLQGFPQADWEPGRIRGWAFADGHAAGGTYDFPNNREHPHLEHVYWPFDLPLDGKPKRRALRSEVRCVLEDTLEPYSGMGIRKIVLHFRGV